MKGKICLITIDGCGAGALPDASRYGDEGTNTLKHVIEKTGISLPNLIDLGLNRILFDDNSHVIGSYGKAKEVSEGKDTTSGHWEIACLSVKMAFPTYPEGFPGEIIKKFEKSTGRLVLGNKAASGTEIIEELGEEHLKDGKLIVYTSADSVFQIAANMAVVTLEELYDYCLKARDLLSGEHKVARVIARPFVGNKPGNFRRLSDKRKDYTVAPHGPTLLDKLVENDVGTHCVGKISEIFGGRGVSKEYKTGTNNEGMTITQELMKELKEGFIFTNLVDFDMVWGHRNDCPGFATGLKNFDDFLPNLTKYMNDEDLLIITADHGCDPTTPGTDHTREYVPILVYGQMAKPVDLGTRQTFADIGQSIAQYYKIKPLSEGESFLCSILKR